MVEECYENDGGFDDLPPHLRANALAASSQDAYSLPPHLRHAAMRVELTPEHSSRRQLYTIHVPSIFSMKSYII